MIVVALPTAATTPAEIPRLASSRAALSAMTQMKTAATTANLPAAVPFAELAQGSAILRRPVQALILPAHPMCPRRMVKAVVIALKVYSARAGNAHREISNARRSWVLTPPRMTPTPAIAKTANCHALHPNLGPESATACSRTSLMALPAVAAGNAIM